MPRNPENTTRVDLSGRIVIPGLVNTHSHLAQSLLRGLAEDLPLKSWLCDAIWKLEASYDADDGYIAAKLTIAEMLKSGTTCFLESMLTHRSGFENVVRAVGETGIRACLVRCISPPQSFLVLTQLQGKLIKFEESNADKSIVDARDKDASFMSISSMLKAHGKHHGSFNDRLHVWAAAGTPRGQTSIHAHEQIGIISKKNDIGFTMHCAEAPQDLEDYSTHYGCTPMQFCEKAELTGPKTVLAHMVNLVTPIDLPIIKKTRTNVAHNPNSNLKLASGIAKIPEMLEAGINVTLGTDGAPCGNTYDMFREMHLAGILHKGNKLDAEVVGAHTVLEMATINGAVALGLGKEIGSLERDKKADFVVVNTRGLHTAPYDEGQILQGGLDPVTTVVYSCTGADVGMVVVDGEILVKDGKLTKMNEQEISEAARQSIKGIRKRSGVMAAEKKGWKYI